MTLGYKFPIFNNIKDIIHIFEDNNNFIIAKKDGYTVINYLRSGKDTHPIVEGFDHAVMREARGLIFDSESGNIISRPFHKFFNVGEREDVMDIDLSKPHVIMDKLDGSMIRPININGSMRWCTKMGITDVAMQAEVFIAKNDNYIKMAAFWMELGYTPIFEWTSRQQRIVIDYEEDNLILLAIRNNNDGWYVPYDNLINICAEFNIPLVKVHMMDWITDYSGDHIAQIKEFVHSMTNIEGFIIQFEDGHMVKLKTDEYVSLHRAKSLLDNERDVVGLILDQKTDDLMPLLPEKDRNRLKRFENDVWMDIIDFNMDVNYILDKTRDMSRKDFALNYECNALKKSCCFAHWDEKVCPVSYHVSEINKKLGSRSGFEKIKPILWTANWKESNINE